MSNTTSPPSTTGTAAADWSAARGEKWLAQLSGMEGMLAPVDEPLIEALRLDAPLRIAEIAFANLARWLAPGGLPPAEAATFALATFASFGELLAKAGDEALARARHSLTARFARHQQDGVVRMDARVHIFAGARLG